MKLRCAQDRLAPGVGVVARAVASRATMPILGNVLLRTSGDQHLLLVATNLEIMLACRVPADIDDAGAVALPARLLTDLVASLHPGPVELELNARTWRLRLQSAPYDALIAGLDPEDFPLAPTFPPGLLFQVAERDLAACITQVAFAAATDNARPVLGGVAMRLLGSELTFAASDGYRLGIRRCAVTHGQESGDLELVVPARSLTELARLLSDSDGRVDVALNQEESQLRFRVREVELIVRLIEGRYVDYTRVIPSAHISRALVERDPLLEAVRVASFFARDSNNVIQIELAPGATKPLVVRSTGGPTGSNEAHIDGEVSGASVTVGFNSHYITEALASVDGSDVALEFGGPLAPCVIRLPDDDHYLHVLMPMRLPK